MSGFIIYSLPRSRTTWLSKFLSYGGWHCGHDELQYVRSLDDVKAWFKQPNTGTVETAGAYWWRLVEQLAPGIKTVIIRRDVGEVLRSLESVGVAAKELPGALRKLEQKLEQIECRVPEVLVLRYEDLGREEVCAELFQHLLPHTHDHAWWEKLAVQNIQIDMAALLRYCVAYKPQMDKLAAQAKQVCLAQLASRKVIEPQGVVIQKESFEDFYRDGQELFKNHLVCVGEAPGTFGEKNLPLMRVLEELGCLQILTARCNGRMFGYLMTVIGPSLESENITSALHTTFYASPDFPGLGLKLQRVALEELRARGVSEVLFRAGDRGPGPKMSALYRRLGAEDFGQLFRLRF